MWQSPHVAIVPRRPYSEPEMGRRRIRAEVDAAEVDAVTPSVMPWPR